MNEEWTATIVAGHQHAGQSSQRGRPHKDVKNEGTSGDVHENTGDDDKVSSDKHGFIHENAPIER